LDIPKKSFRNLKRYFRYQTMEKVANLPTKKINISPHEKEVMNKYFGESSPPSEEGGGDDDVPSKGSTIKWKLVGYTALVFLLLANPWIDTIFCLVPYCGNSLSMFAIKTLLFCIAFVIISKYAV
jgi:hypothetical protein